MTTTSLKPPRTTNLDRYWNQPRLKRGVYRTELSPEAQEALARDTRWRPEHTNGHPVRPRTAEEILASGKPRSTQRAAELRQLIFQTATRHCRAHGATTSRAVALVIGVTDGCVNHHMHALADAGVFRNTRDGYGPNTWRLTEDEGGGQ